MKKLILFLLLLAPVSVYAQQPNSFSLSLTDRGLWKSDAGRANRSEFLTIAIGRRATFSGQAGVLGSISGIVVIDPKFGLKLRVFF